jgi:hypothetical protein
LTRCLNRLNEAVAQVFSGGVRNPPGLNEGLNVARTMANELDSAKFDPLLVKSVAKNVVTSLEQLVSRWDALVRLPPSRLSVDNHGSPNRLSPTGLRLC